jgi:hypothetical protein
MEVLHISTSTRKRDTINSEDVKPLLGVEIHNLNGR